MNKWRLFRWVLWRGLASGVVLGAIFGMTITSIFFITGYMAVCFIGFFAGALWGGLLGLIFGAVNGLVLLLFTRISSNHYRLSAVLLAMTCTLVISIATLNLLITDLHTLNLMVTSIATVTAGFFAWQLPDADKPQLFRVSSANRDLFYFKK